MWERPAPGAPGNGTDLTWEGAPWGNVDLEKPGLVDLWGNGTLVPWDPDRDGPTPGQMDVNECANFAGLCAHGTCRNTMGSFTCDCDPGYGMVTITL